MTCRRASIHTLPAPAPQPERLQEPLLPALLVLPVLLQEPLARVRARLLLVCQEALLSPSSVLRC